MLTLNYSSLGFSFIKLTYYNITNNDIISQGAKQH